MTRNDPEHTNPHPRITDQALPVSVLPPQDADEAICPKHGPMEDRGKQVIKNNGTLWLPEDGQRLYVCPDCASGIADKAGTTPGKVITLFVVDMFDNHLKNHYRDTGIGLEKAKEMLDDD